MKSDPMSESISSPSGFFFATPETPTTATDLASAIADAEANLAAAGTSAADAAASASAAASSATAAASSATTASGATTSATAAAASATNAATSATNAATSATAAAGSATTASTQATNAATSAASASGSATSASTQATNAATSATNAGNSATAAAGSASGAATSATNASASAATAASAAGAQSGANVGRNKLLNSTFLVAQLGAGPFTASGYTLDGWFAFAAHSTGSLSVTQSTLSDADRTAIGDEDASLALGYVFTGGTGAADLDGIQQRIENVRRLAGKQVTVSFWAVAAAGSPKVGISIDQNFGTGGSPSTGVNGTGTLVTLSTTWARYTATVTLPSIIGKTLGTNGDSFTNVNLWLSSGSTNNVRSGSVGVQSGTVTFWGVQLEVGGVVTPLEKLNYAIDLAQCQRFYQIGQFAMLAYSAAGVLVGQSLLLPVTMRAPPTCVPTFTTQTNASGGSILALGPWGVEFFATTTATGAVGLAGSFTASARL
jgi:hypothetical protein